MRIGVNGVLGVMRENGMLVPSKAGRAKIDPIRSDSSHWLRAPVGGLMRARKKLSERVEAGETIAIISDPLGSVEDAVTARAAGVIIGRSNLPVVNRGDALFHVAKVRSLTKAEKAVDDVEMQAEADPLFDDDMIV